MCWKIEIHVKVYYSQDIINSTYIKKVEYISPSICLCCLEKLQPDMSYLEAIWR